MAKAFRPFVFSIPSLPKDVYLRLQKFCEAHGLTQWQGIITLLETTWRFGKEQPDVVAGIAGEVRDRFPR